MAPNGSGQTYRQDCEVFAFETIDLIDWSLKSCIGAAIFSATKAFVRVEGGEFETRTVQESRYVIQTYYDMSISQAPHPTILDVASSPSSVHRDYPPHACLPPTFPFSAKG